MTTINDIIKNESPTDVILFLTRNNTGITFQRLDGLYNRNNWIHISNNLNLLTLIKQMKENKLIKDAGPMLVQGPQWYEPDFVLKNKYTFD